MAWENLEAEIAAELSDARPETAPVAWTEGHGGANARSPVLSSAPLRIEDRNRGPKDNNDLRWNRRMLAKKRAQYTSKDRNRTYTVRKAVRVYQRGATCANDVSGRFLPQAS